MLRAVPFALTLLVPAALASAQEADETPSLTWVLERAQELDARTEYLPASELYEVYAEACLESSTAPAERGDPCRRSDDALRRAFELRVALGQSEAASVNAARFREHFLYARPRQAMQVGYLLARMHLDAGRYEAALSELAAIDQHFEVASARQAILSDGMRARIADAVGRQDVSTQLWRRVERRFEADRAQVEGDGPLPLTWVLDVLAEGRLQRARPLVDRFFATRAPRLRNVRSDQRWWRRVSTWQTRSRRRLALARHALEQVYELGSARHSVIAAARIGEMYAHQTEVHASLARPEREYLLVLVRDGNDRPGYEPARTHFEACLAWSSHHGVAPSWAERRERGLHRLDPDSFPLSAELHGEASYLPLAGVRPPGLVE